MGLNDEPFCDDKTLGELKLREGTVLDLVTKARMLIHQMVQDPIEIKDKVSDTERIPPRRQHLVYNGKLLNDDKKPVADLDITHDDTLEMTVGVPMNILVQPPEAQPIPLKVDTSDTIKDVKDQLKNKVADTEEIPPERQPLDDKKCLSDYDNQIKDRLI